MSAAATAILIVITRNAGNPRPGTIIVARNARTSPRSAMILTPLSRGPLPAIRFRKTWTGLYLKGAVASGAGGQPRGPGAGRVITAIRLYRIPRVTRVERVHDGGRPRDHLRGLRDREPPHCDGLLRVRDEAEGCAEGPGGREAPRGAHREARRGGGGEGRGGPGPGQGDCRPAPGLPPRGDVCRGGRGGREGGGPGAPCSHPRAATPRAARAGRGAVRVPRVRHVRRGGREDVPVVRRAVRGARRCSHGGGGRGAGPGGARGGADGDAGGRPRGRGLRDGDVEGERAQRAAHRPRRVR